MREKGRNKRGVQKKGYVYTIAVIFFTGLLLAIFYTQSNIGMTSNEQSPTATMDDFLSDFERDAQRAAFIAGFRSLIALEEHVASQGEYLNNFSGRFEEAFLNASVNGIAYEVIENATFEDYLMRVNYEAQKTGLKFDAQVKEVVVYHLTPWTVAVDFRTRVLLNDSRDRTRFDYEKTFSSSFSILDLRDPIYSVETNNKAPNIVRTIAYDEFVDDAGDKNDTTVLSNFLNESYYTDSHNAPSFLMRFSGNFSPDENGMQSLVNLNELDTQGIDINTAYSVVDYEYFAGIGATWCDIQNMPNYFKVTNENSDYYEITTELERTAC